MNIHVACGSWADDEYVGVLYPEDLPSKQRLSGYARWFDHVEVNSTYYAIPQRSTVEGWLAQTPPGFTFNVKLHRVFSQSPARAAQEGELVSKLLAAVEPLVKQNRLAAFFLVMPPSFGPDRRKLAELDAIAEALRPHVLAVELRHRAWVTGVQKQKTLDYFRERRLAWIAVDMPQIEDSTLMPPVDAVTDPRCAYFRLHGRNARYLEAKTAEEGHTYAYNEVELKELAERVRRVGGQAEFVHVVANNHAQNFAPKTALALQKLFGIQPPSPVKFNVQETLFGEVEPPSPRRKKPTAKSPKKQD
jgi:uncharacterized protein YecE (DUF72 family)